jgi:uncharacterized membrane protein YukC
MNNLKLSIPKLNHLFKKYGFQILIIIIFLLLIYNLYFVYSQIKTKNLTEQGITSKQETINQDLYNSVIEKSKTKQKIDLNKINSLNNIF